MSGIEIAGLLLAVLPFFIEGGKLSARYLGAARKAKSRGAGDEALLEFYQKFWWNTLDLKETLHELVEYLPGLSNQRKTELVENWEPENWCKSQDVERALQDFLGSSAAVEEFFEVNAHVLELFSRLIKDETLKISKAELVRRLRRQVACHL